MLLMVTSLLTACDSEPAYQVTFCDTLVDDQCLQDTNQFEMGRKVYVQLSAEDGFGADEIVGSIYKLTEGKRLEMGAKRFDVTPEDSYIIQDIPFDEFGMQALGNFEIVFTNQSNESIAVGKLEIVQP